LGIFSSTLSKSPVLPLFAANLGAGPAAIGVVASVSAFTGVLISLPAGLLSDKLGRRNLLLLSALVFGSAPFLYLTVDNIWQLGAVRFYHGLATAVFIPVAMALVADLFPHTRAEKMGWFSAATLMGRFLAPLAGGALLGWFAASPKTGFQAVYIGCGIAGLLVLGLAVFLPEPRVGHAESLSWHEAKNTMLLLAGDGCILATCLTEAGVLFAYGVFEVFLPLYAIEIGLGAHQVGALLASQIITLALTKPLLGRFSDRHGRSPQIAVGCFLAALGVGLFPLLRIFWSLFVLSVIFGFSLSVITSASSALVADLSEEKGRGSAMGLLGTIMDIGHTTGPLLGGFVAVWLGLKGPFWLAALLPGSIVPFFIYSMRLASAGQSS